MHAIVFVQLGPVSADRQIAQCMAYIRECGYELAGIIRAGGSARDAVVMVARGLAGVVVVGYGGRRLAGDVVAVGGRVEAVHPTPHVVEPYTAAPRSLVQQLRDRGKTVAEIADILNETTGEIRRKLA